MKTKIKKRTWRVLGAASALVLAMGIAIPAALAVHDTGAFELDGNATNAAATPGDDWDNVCHQVLGNDCSTTDNTNGATAVDWVAEPNLNSTIFTGGGSKDPQEISNWQWKNGAGGLPDKDNLLHSFAARYSLPSTGATTGTCPSGTALKCELLYFGSDRYDNSGDAQQGFWFFQNEITLNGTTSGTFNGLHKEGDLLVVSDFSNGGTTSTITVYSWDPTCTKAAGPNPTAGQCGDANLRVLATSTNASCNGAGTGDKFCGLVNASTITMPWSFTDKSGTLNNGALNGEFYEGGVNLSQLGLADRCFQSVASETRSSTSTTATLKDFILGKFGACKTEVHTTPKDADGNGIPAGGLSIGTGSVQVTDQATVTVTGTTTWTGNLQFSLCGPAAAACATGGTAIGSPISISNTPTQPISSVKATVTSVGTYCWRADFTSTTTGVPNGSDGSATECFTVNPVTPQLSTQAGAGPVDLGQPITDEATLTETANKPGTPVINPTTAGGPAGGTIIFTAYGPDSCTTVAFTSDPVSVSGDATYGPVSFTPTAPGTYHWAAVYSGDPPNTNGTSHNLDCSDTNEDVVVTSVPSSMTTAQSFIPNDSATVSASQGGNLAGSVTFKAFENADCSGGSPIVNETVNVAGASPKTVSTTNTTVSTTAAHVSWLVSYDSTNPAQEDIPATCFEKTDLTIDNDGTVSSP
jgi:hypothetical protein